MLKQIFVGLFVALLGGVLIYFSQAVTDLFWRIEWFEHNIGSTRNWYVISWFLIVVVGFLIMFGVFPIGQPITEQTPTLGS
jgi:formate hydrogenlyase subunit 3/multisubunit Na+/H+ antiporter MnhD subunit